MLKNRFFPIYIGIFILIADQLSKYLTHTFIPLMRYDWVWYPYGGIGIFQNFYGIEFSISHHINRGAAWGIFSNYQKPLLYGRIALISLLTCYAFFFNKHRNLNIPLALVIAGALGNVLDFFFYGHVVDMLHFILWNYDFPVFNVADSSIFIGISWLLIASNFEKKLAA